MHHDGCPRVSHGLCRHSLLSWMLREPTDVSRLSSVRGCWAIAANPCLSIYLTSGFLIVVIFSVIGSQSEERRAT